MEAIFVAGCLVGLSFGIIIGIFLERKITKLWRNTAHEWKEAAGAWKDLAFKWEKTSNEWCNLALKWKQMALYH